MSIHAFPASARAGGLTTGTQPPDNDGMDARLTKLRRLHFWHLVVNGLQPSPAPVRGVFCMNAMRKASWLPVPMRQRATLSWSLCHRLWTVFTTKLLPCCFCNGPWCCRFQLRTNKLLHGLKGRRRATCCNTECAAVGDGDFVHSSTSSALKKSITQTMKINAQSVPTTPHTHIDGALRSISSHTTA